MSRILNVCVPVRPSARPLVRNSSPIEKQFVCEFSASSPRGEINYNPGGACFFRPPSRMNWMRMVVFAFHVAPWLLDTLLEQPWREMPTTPKASHCAAQEYPELCCFLGTHMHLSRRRHSPAHKIIIQNCYTALLTPGSRAMRRRSKIFRAIFECSIS